MRRQHPYRLPQLLGTAALLLGAATGAAAQGEPAIPELGARVTRLRFFEGPKAMPSLRDRQYATRFDSATVRSIFVEIGLAYPPTKSPVALKIDCGFTPPGGGAPRTARVAPRDGERHDVVLYLGCNVLRTSHMVQTVSAVFDRLGLDYVAAGGPTYCCGIQHHRRGQEASGERFANHTIELLQKMAPREVVMWCPSCIQFYDEVLQADLPFPKRHAAEFLAERLERGEFAFTQRVDATVALHYHRATEPRRREGRAARRLLEGVPGLTLVEFEPDPRWGRTCTPALQTELGPDAWRQMALDDADRALAAGATHMAGIYHGCHRDLCRFEAERPLVFEHYLTLFARALGIEFEDTYKKYMRWGDPDRILEDATPCMAANGIDPAIARGLVIKTFSAKS